MDTSIIRKLRLGDTLIEMGYITNEQLGQALAYQKEHKGERIGAILITLGFISERQMLSALADRLNIEVIEISSRKVDMEAIRLIDTASLAFCILLLFYNILVARYIPFPIYGFRTDDGKNRRGIVSIKVRFLLLV